LTPTPWTGEDAALIDSQIFRVSDTIDKLYGAAAATAKQKQAPVTRIDNRFESRLAEHIGELSEAVVSEWQVEELLRMRDAIAGLTAGGGAEPISDEREGGQARPRRQRRERADESTLVAREAELRGAIVALERVRELARDDVRFEPDDFDRILDDASQLLEDTPDAGDKAVPHRGMWTNKTGQTVNDLHVTFDRPGVKWVDPNGQRGYFPSGRDATPASEAGTKTEIDLYGGNVTANSPARGKFTRDGGDFKVESWYWTLDGEKVGDTITDPPDQWE
jgi:hypothetical protein